MTAEHRVLQHLRELNPVVDETALVLPATSPTAFLEALKRSAAPDARRKLMSVETTTRDTARTPTPGRRRNLVLALGTAAVVAIAIVVGIAIAGSDSGDEVAAAPPIQVAEQIMEAHIAGGPVTMLEFLEPAYADLERPEQEVFQIFNERIIGGQYSCEQTRANRVLCRTPTTNDYHGSGGFEPEVTWMITFNEKSEVIDLHQLALQAQKLTEFNEAFSAWLVDTYPDLASAGFSPTADPDAARIAIQYVDEFVAQSDDYPISP